MLTRIEHVLNTAEIARLLATFASVAAVAGSETALGQAAAAKHNLQLPPDHPAVRDAQRLVLAALQRHPQFYAAVYPRRAYPPLFSRYEPGMSYGNHVDSAVMLTPAALRTDVAVTVFLADPASYDGGELVIADGADETRIKLGAGALVAYPPAFVHRVAPVTRGVRYAAVTWIESMIRDAERRRLLQQLDQSMTALHARIGDGPELRSLNNTYHTLLRMWAET